MRSLFVRGLIVGLLAGQLLMVPHIVKWMTCPVIYVEIVSEAIYDQVGEQRYLMKDVISKRIPEPRPLEVVITNPYNIRKYCQDLLGGSEDDCALVMGFYYYDKVNQKHMVLSVDSTAVLQHEFRHVFEAHYHRYLTEWTKLK